MMVGQPYGQKLAASSPKASNFREGDRNFLFWDALWLAQPLSHDHLWANHNRQMVDTLRTAVVWVFKGWIGQFSMNYNLLEKNWQSVRIQLGFWQKFSQKWMKWTCRFKESNWQCLLPVVKFELSRKNFNFERHVFVAMFDNVPTLKDLSETGGDINKWSF